MSVTDMMLKEIEEEEKKKKMIETNIPCPKCGTVIDCSKMEEAILNKFIKILKDKKR